MADLVYYAEENARHPDLHKARCSEAEASEAVCRILTRTLGKRRARAVTLSFRNIGGGHASKWGIRLGRAGLNWLLVIHEVAHTIDESRHPDKKRWHSRAHARIVDNLADFIKREGWPAGTLAHDLALRDLERSATAERREGRRAAAKTTSARIEKRRAQVKRLETRIKSLTTRLKSALRSLGALERAQAKREAKLGAVLASVEDPTPDWAKQPSRPRRMRLRRALDNSPRLS